jgi:hypothetical protein
MIQKYKFLVLLMAFSLFGVTFSVLADTAPIAPSNLTVIPNGNSAILTWQDNSDNEAGFKIYRGPVWTDIGNVGVNITTFTDSGLSAGTYPYHLQAFSLSATGSPVYSTVSNDFIVSIGSTSSGTSSTSGNTGTNLSIPPVPTGLNATLATTLHSVNLGWTDVSGNESEYRIYNRISGSTLWNQIGTVSANTTVFSYSFNPPNSNTVFDFAVAGCNSLGCSSYSNSASLTLPASTNSGTGTGTPTTSVSAPMPPSNLTATASDKGVVLNWTDNSNNESGFKIYRGPLWTDIGNVNSNITTFVDTAVTAGSYSYRVQSFLNTSTGYLYSLVSNDASVTVGGSTITASSTKNLSGIVSFSDNTPVTDAQVKVSSATNIAPVTTNTDPAGNYTLKLPGGSYNVTIAPISSTASWSYGHNPQTVSFNLDTSSESKTLNFTVEKNTLSVSSQTIRGITKLEDGSVAAHAQVWAWSDAGDNKSLLSGADGTFSLSARSGQTWHIGSGLDISGVPYKANEISVLVGTADITKELILAKSNTASITIGTQTASPTGTITANTSDGAGVVIPPNAASVSTSSVTVTIQATAIAPVFANAAPISTVYDVTMKDSSGNKVTSFNSLIDVKIPYDQNQIASQGISEQSLKPSYFDEASNTWVQVNNYTLDTVNKVVVAHVNHLTRFAIVLPADTTPPLPPSAWRALTLASSAVKLFWKNPDKDFKFIKIYRSTTADSIGQLVQKDITDQVFVDTTTKTGSDYYYLIHAVDPAGNESANTRPMLVHAKVGSKSPLPGVPEYKPITLLARDLKSGSSGSDVKVLQQFLKSQGLLNVKNPTAYFGSMTKNSLLKFQANYSINQDGKVSSATKDKINELLLLGN